VLKRPADGFDLALKCYEALMRLASLYEKCKALSAWMFAVFKGKNHEATLRAHTSEGAISRKLFRCCKFKPPFGVLMSGFEESKTIPGIGEETPEQLAAWSDSHILYAAAACGCADPLYEINARSYPTVLGRGVPKEAFSKGDIVGKTKNQHITILTNQMSRSIYTWAREMVKVFCMMVQKSWTSEKAVADQIYSFIRIQCNSMMCRVDTHFEHQIIAPYTWVECNGIIGSEANHLRAVEEGLGPMCSLNGRKEMMKGTEFSSMNKLDETNYDVELDFTVMRKNPLVIAALLNNDKKLGDSLCLKMFSSNDITLGKELERMPNDVFAGNLRAKDCLVWNKAHTETVLPGCSLCYQGCLTMGCIKPDVISGYRTRGVMLTASDFEQDVGIYVSGLEANGFVKKPPKHNQKLVEHSLTHTPALHILWKDKKSTIRRYQCFLEHSVQTLI
jgi:hypothetical protein